MSFGPLVSVIIPCYNQAQYLPDAISSVINQTYQNFECIIINDGSTDNTEEISLGWCNKDARFRYLQQENGGLSSARNAGLKVAAGEYIQFLDSDDLLKKGKLCQQLSFLSENQDVDIVYSESVYFLNDNPNKTSVFGRNGLVPTINLDKNNIDQIYPLLWRNVTTICSTLYRRSVFKLVPWFDLNLSSLEDWDFHFRCAKNGLKFHFLKSFESGVLIRIHQRSMLTDRKRTLEAQDILMKKIRSSLSDEEVFYYKELGLPPRLFSESTQSKYFKIDRFFKRSLWGKH